MTEEEKLALIKKLEKRIPGNDINEHEKVGASTSNVKSKVSFWKQIHRESVFDKEEEQIKETAAAANDTNELFDELFAENYDDSLSESVIQQFNVLAEQAETEKPRKNRSSRSTIKRKIQWWRYFNFEICTTSWVL